MRLQSLRHLVEVAQAASRSDRIIVLGSSSLLGFFPELGEEGQVLEASYDADLLIEPCDDELAAMIDEAIGSERKFHARYGYHADLLRPEITKQLPSGWDSRLAPLEGCEGVFCIEPHDLAVAKLQAGRPKDLEVLTILLRERKLDAETIRDRLKQTWLRESLIVVTHRRLNSLVDALELG